MVHTSLEKSLKMLWVLQNSFDLETFVNSDLETFSFPLEDESFDCDGFLRDVFGETTQKEVVSTIIFNLHRRNLWKKVIFTKYKTFTNWIQKNYLQIQNIYKLNTKYLQIHEFKLPAVLLVHIPRLLQVVLYFLLLLQILRHHPLL